MGCPFLLAGAQILHLLIVLSCSLFQKKCHKQHFGHQDASARSESKLSRCVFSPAEAQDLALSVVQNKDTEHSQGTESTMLF